MPLTNRITDFTPQVRTYFRVIRWKGQTVHKTATVRQTETERQTFMQFTTNNSLSVVNILNWTVSV